MEPDGIEGFAHRKTSPLSPFSPKFLVILSTRQTNIKYILCLGLNPYRSSRIILRSLKSCMILDIKIVSNSFRIVSKKPMG